MLFNSFLLSCRGRGTEWVKPPYPAFHRDPSACALLSDLFFMGIPGHRCDHGHVRWCSHGTAYEHTAKTSPRRLTRRRRKVLLFWESHNRSPEHRSSQVIRCFTLYSQTSVASRMRRALYPSVSTFASVPVSVTSVLDFGYSDTAASGIKRTLSAQQEPGSATTR